jgi:hypothetical protein
LGAALRGARIERAYIDTRHHDGDVDLVIVMAGRALTLTGACTRRPGRERWSKSVSYDHCQRWLVGAEIIDLIFKDEGRSVTFWLDNGITLTGNPA